MLETQRSNSPQGATLITTLVCNLYSGQAVSIAKTTDLSTSYFSGTVSRIFVEMI